MYDAVIIGAGVIGVSIARALALKKPQWKIAVLEKEANVACHTSGRNSGVVHSGFNPKPGTLKARFCVEGNQRITDLSLKKNIPFQRVGTVVLASKSSEIQTLEELLKRGTTNGVPNLKILDTKGLKNVEPFAQGVAALHAPTGGIIDSRKFVEALAEESRECGVSFLFKNRVLGIEENSGRYSIKTDYGKIQAEHIINSAGLYADTIAHMMEVGEEYSIIPFRGEYFSIPSSRSYLVRSMIYHIPDMVYPFLGIHFTRTVNGDILVGPNAVLALGRESYSTRKVYWRETIAIFRDIKFWKLLFKPEFRFIALKGLHTSLSKKAFLREARFLVPALNEKDLMSGRAGNRAQVVDDDGNLIDDIVIKKKGSTLHILNVVSPGFTCSLPFADYIVEQI
jgi:L-2-hydroxyglutarate oxidase LhgO